MAEFTALSCHEVGGNAYNSTIPLNTHTPSADVTWYIGRLALPLDRLRFFLYEPLDESQITGEY